MITRRKIEEYIHFGGDIDGWVRCNRDEKGIITEDEWSFLDLMVSQIGIIRKGHAAPEFKDRHEEKIHLGFDSPATYNQLAAFEKRSEQGTGGNAF